MARKAHDVKRRETTRPLAEKVVSAITALLYGLVSARSLITSTPYVKHRDSKLFLLGMLLGMVIGVLLVLGLVLLGLKSVAQTTGRV